MDDLEIGTIVSHPKWFFKVTDFPDLAIRTQDVISALRRASKYMTFIHKHKYHIYI